MSWIERVTYDDNPVGALFNLIIYTLIVLSLVLFAVETLPQSANYEDWFVWSERIIVGVFSIEYILRLIAARCRYALSGFGLIDFLAILPFYIAVGVDLRSIRILRLLRLLRIAKLRRFGTAWSQLRSAFAEIKDELAVYFGLTVMLVYLASVGIYYCEHDAQPEAFQSIFHAMWWAVCTLSTVGYGDVYPVTLAGRLLTFVILVLGLSVVSVPSGLLAAAMVRMRNKPSIGV